MRLPQIREIAERKLVQWGLAYLAGAWLVLQVVDVLGDIYGWPAGFLRAVPVVLAVGFFAALVLAWCHGDRGVQRVTAVELSILATLLVIAGVGVVMTAGGGGAAADNAAEVPSDLVGEAVDEIPIAVLPFEAIGGHEVFAAGLTDELHQTLSLVPAFRVTARTSAKAFAGADVSADSIGRALGVAHLVEGTVRSFGDQVRIAARLVSTESGLQEWSETFDRDVADLLAVQEEIARAVGSELRVEVGVATWVRQVSADPRAYDLVVRARQLHERGSGDWSQIFEEAMALYQEAIVLDSTYAPAWSGLARVRSMALQGNHFAEPEPQRALRTAEAERALALDPNDAVAHDLIGQLANNRGDYEKAKFHLERAVQAGPTNGEFVGRLAITLLESGDGAGALRTAERAATLDPLNDNTLYSAAYIFSSMGRHDEAVALGRDMQALVPYDVGKIAGLANFLAAAGRAEEAIELATFVVEGSPQWQHARDILAFSYAQAGDRENAERIWAAGHQRQSILATLEAALGDRDAAFAAMEASLAAGESSARQFHTDNWLQSLRDDPRWEPLMERIRQEFEGGGGGL